MDLFRCDKCKTILFKSSKKGRLIVQELGENDGLAHPALYNRKLDLCLICFDGFRNMMDPIAERPSFAEASDITKAAVFCPSDEALLGGGEQ